MSIAIKVENLSKAYQIGKIGTGTISRDLERWVARVRGKGDPFLKIGETNDQRIKSSSDMVWSLKDINFEIEQGDAVGIIGRNGAGKSTLLKILSRVTSPTKGKISGRGRIASLLEVGTGFHPELSGRENIFLNGAILGMRKKEIQRKLEEIVDFAGVERYLDTPVKRYSSGMYVRLAFAVAAHLESEILIVDEVLAVGDAEFQKKCLGKMNDVSKGEGRTVLFVSHNMEAIQKLCREAILLKDGMLISKENSSALISNYISDDAVNNYFTSTLDSRKKIQILKAEIESIEHDKIIINTQINSIEDDSCSIDFRISDNLQNPFAFGSLGTLDYGKLCRIRKGLNIIQIEMNIGHIADGTYFVSIDLTNPNIEFFDRANICLRFVVIKNHITDTKRSLMQNWNYGNYNIDLKEVKNV